MRGKGGPPGALGSRSLEAEGNSRRREMAVTRRTRRAQNPAYGLLRFFPGKMAVSALVERLFVPFVRFHKSVKMLDTTSMYYRMAAKWEMVGKGGLGGQNDFSRTV
jgi:hypothetical protein